MKNKRLYQILILLLVILNMRTLGFIWFHKSNKDKQARPVALNAANYSGYHDWRLPNIKELQSIVDYTRSPKCTNSAAIDSILHCTQIIDEAGYTNWPWYWNVIPALSFSKNFIE